MKKQKPSIGTKFSPILVEIEEALWDFEYAHPGKQFNFSVFGFRAAIKIFMATFLGEIWKKQAKELMPQAEREKMAQEAGQAIRMLIKQYTDIDSHDLYKI